MDCLINLFIEYMKMNNIPMNDYELTYQLLIIKDEIKKRLLNNKNN